MKGAETQNRFSGEARAAFGDAPSYQEFLRVYFRETRLSYAEVARRGGFSSRSYPRDVTEGRRRLTAKSLPSLLRGLRLDPALSRLLQALYYFEYPEEHPEALPFAAVQARLEKERGRARQIGRISARQKSLPPELNGLGDRDLSHLAAGLTDVVAALGELEKGATLEELQRRTGLGKAKLASHLAALREAGVVRYEADARRYFPSTAHLDWTGQAKSRLANAAYRSAVERLGEAALLHFTHPETVFLNSAFSVAKQDMPRLKEELKAVLLKFVDRSVAQSAAPDTVVQIVIGFFEGRLAPPRAF